MIQLPAILGIACAGLLVVSWGLYERGEARTAAVQAKFDKFKGEQAAEALAQSLAIAKESAARAAEHLENVRGIVAAAETGQKEIRYVAVAPGCEKDALSDATAGAVRRVWGERAPGAGNLPADRRDPARALPGPAAAGNRQAPAR